MVPNSVVGTPSVGVEAVATSLFRVGVTLIVIGAAMIILSFDYLTAALAIATGAVTVQLFQLPVSDALRRCSPVFPPSQSRECCSSNNDCCGAGTSRHIRPLLISVLVFACLNFAWTVTLALIFAIHVGGPATSWFSFAAIGDAATIITSGIGISNIIEWEMRIREIQAAAGGVTGQSLVSYGVPAGSTSIYGGRIFVVTANGSPGSVPAGGGAHVGMFPGQQSSAVVYPGAAVSYGYAATDPQPLAAQLPVAQEYTSAKTFSASPPAP